MAGAKEEDEQAAPIPPLPEPGEIVFYDYRRGPPQAAATASSSAEAREGEEEKQGGNANDNNKGGAQTPPWRLRASRRALRLVQFNVERGYELPRVIEELKKLDADVIALQEVDVGCDRSGGEDVGRAIANALGLCGFFLSEFQELHSPLRDYRSQGGGVHGNAILSRYDLRHARRVDHSHEPVDWSLDPDRQPHALARREPRRGRRATLAVRVFPPWLSSSSSSSSSSVSGVLVYSAHLEVFCGAADRAAQFADIVADARNERGRELSDAAAAAAAAASSAAVPPRPPPPPPPPPPRHAILGDLNTMAHGVARLSPHYAQGSLRWRTLGLTEGEWWERHVLWRPPTPLVEEEEEEGASPPQMRRRRRRSSGDGGATTGARGRRTGLAASAGRRRLLLWSWRRC